MNVSRYKRSDCQTVASFEEQESSKGLVVLVHGLGDNKDSRLVYNGAKFFQDKGFDTLRPSMYFSEEGFRLEDGSITDFKRRVQLVLEEHCSDYDNIYLVGHSLGFVSVLTDLEHVDRVVLWDPVFGLNEDKASLHYSEDLDKYLMKWDVTILLDPEMKEEWSNIDTREALSSISKPVKMIMAGEDHLKHRIKENKEDIKVENEIEIIEGAGHNFAEGNKEDQLKKSTLEWFEDN